MKPVLGLLLIGGGIVMMVALFTGRLGLPGLTAGSYDLSAYKNTPGLSGNPGVPPVSLPSQKGTNCPQGYIYSPVSKNCQSLAGI